MTLLLFLPFSFPKHIHIIFLEKKDAHALKKIQRGPVKIINTMQSRSLMQRQYKLAASHKSPGDFHYGFTKPVGTGPV